MSAGVTQVEVATEGGSAAISDVAQHGLLRDRGVMPEAELIAVRAHDLGDLEARPVGSFCGHCGSTQNVRRRRAQ